MARYRIAKIGVLDQDNGDAHVLPGHAGWGAYLNWLAAGNVPGALIGAVLSAGVIVLIAGRELRAWASG